ncbi:tRNA pseudouridine(55) synthase TruB [Alkalilimnicola ehrlichii MLHE-1]|uniref:tRNA pseudouridine synthase B n=1 Tax=Alkalilimnicola ehrlichii (strain ATCC BAA-1101 / DSM 17681 / MLHE-1) TaxID=187272 RepID=Q0A799_ALKEH|nr:tRNA pseudouridine(55) synthase TruB [Alkalilimnicola ehrlichii]ABI57288.1 tRNA pseudouridine synthase B [Alkalilimnicola ehrlichii MLHE-1]
MARKHLRRVNGILLLDKPAGLSSNQALQRAKRLFQARKAGHTGSLDPLATGLLPLCFGEATKVSGFLLDADKHYQVRCRLGVTTDTGDAEGEVLEETPVPALDADRVEAALAGFRGDIEQVPPMYSALKHKGQRLYKLAREGKEVNREPRPVRINGLTLVALEGDTLALDVRCSKGTYVRTLVEDIGRALGCGAHVIGLRRTGLGPFDDPDMFTLEALEAAAGEGLEALDNCLLPMDSALVQWPAVELAEDVAFFLMQGQPVWVPRIPEAAWLRLYTREGRFLGMGCPDAEGRIAPKRLLATGGGGKQ